MSRTLLSLVFLAVGSHSMLAGPLDPFAGWCRDHPTANARFFRQGGRDGVIDLSDEVEGLRIYVFGPPTSSQQLFKDLPTKKGRETYEEEDVTHSQVPLPQRSLP